MKKLFFSWLLFMAMVQAFPLMAQEAAEEVLEYYDNGNKKVEGQLLNGQKHGLWQEWYVDGNKKSKVQYQEDQKNGRWVEWYHNGGKKSQKFYKAGTPQARWMEWDEYGKLRHVTGFFDSGDKKLEILLEQTREGTVKTYREWLKNGNKRLDQQMKQQGEKDIWHGYYKEWFEDGTLALDTHYKEGKEDGLHRDYYEHGGLRMEMEMTQGKKNGVATFWNEEGVKQWVKVYRDDRFVRSNLLDQ